MSGTLKHSDTSTKPAATDTAKIDGPKWNKDHIFHGGTQGAFLCWNEGDTDHVTWRPQAEVVLVNDTLDHQMFGKWQFGRDEGAPETISIEILNDSTLVFRGSGTTFVISRNFIIAHANFGIYFTPTPGDILSDPPDVGIERAAPSVVRITSGVPGFGTGLGGGIALGDTAARNPKPAASAAARGTVWVTHGESGTADVVEVCVKRADDTYVWQPLAFETGAPE